MAKEIELTASGGGGESLTQLLPLATADGELLTVAALLAAARSQVADDKAFWMRYTDSDGDEVTIASDADVKELAGYMADEELERLTVRVVPAGSAMQTQLRGLVTAMAKLTTAKPKQPSPANALNLLVASLETMDVAEDSAELAAVKQQLLGVLQAEEFRQAVEELSATEEFKNLADTMAAAIYQEDARAIEMTATARFDELLVFAQRVVARCPSLKPVMVDVAKKCVGGLLRYNDEEMANDGSDLSSSSSSTSSCEEILVDASDGGVEEVPVHISVACDGCDQAPLVGIRYKSLEDEDFDLCEACEASGKWASHEPFIKITDPSRAPKPKRSTELMVHPFVVCDGCEMSPIIGTRFNSKTAEDFDLCEACEASGKWNESHGPFTKIEEPGMMHALKFTWGRHGKFGRHHGKFGHGHGKFGRHGHHHGPPDFSPPPHHRGPPDFGRHGDHHGPPGFPASPLHRGPPEFGHHGPQSHHEGPPGYGPPPRREGPPGYGPPPHHENPRGFPGYGPLPRREGPPDFRHGPPPRCESPPDFGGRGRPDFHGFHGHGPPPPPPEFDRPWHRNGPRGYGPPDSFTPRFGFPDRAPCPPRFDPRACDDFFGRGRPGRRTHSPEREQERFNRRDCRGRGRWGRDASDLEARFLEDVTIEDGTVVEAGKPLRKMWKLVNDGERSWPDGCYMITQRGNPLFPEGRASSRIDLPPLDPGQEFIAGVDLVAPNQPGRYSSFWRVCDPADASFGHRFWIDIVVAGVAAPEATPSEAPTADSAEDSEMKDSPEVAPPADASSDDDIEIIETAEAQEAEAEAGANEVDIVEEDKIEENTNEVIFKKSLETLASMGFTDENQNLRALELADGNVGGAVNVLLSE